MYNEDNKNYFRTSDLPTITKLLKGISSNAPHIKTIVIDTLTGALTDKMMADSKKVGYDKWNDLSESAYELYDFIRDHMRDDIIVFIMAHVQVVTDNRPDGTVVSRYTTKYPGKKLTSLSMNSKLNYILYTKVEAEGGGEISYQFITQNDGTTEARSSFGVLPLLMPNNLEDVRKAISEAESN